MYSRTYIYISLHLLLTYSKLGKTILLDMVGMYVYVARGCRVGPWRGFIMTAYIFLLGIRASGSDEGGRERKVMWKTVTPHLWWEGGDVVWMLSEEFGDIKEHVIKKDRGKRHILPYRELRT